MRNSGCTASNKLGLFLFYDFFRVMAGQTKYRSLADGPAEKKEPVGRQREKKKSRMFENRSRGHSGVFSAVSSMFPLLRPHAFRPSARADARFPARGARSGNAESSSFLRNARRPSVCARLFPLFHLLFDWPSGLIFLRRAFVRPDVGVAGNGSGD